MRKKLEHRRQGSRSAKRFIVHTEGTCTEPAYFEALRYFGLIRNAISIETLGPVEHRSDPYSLLSQAKTSRTKHSLHEFDEVWIVFDRDHSKIPILTKTLSEAKKSDVKVAMSNPCFEYWLLCHHERPTQNFSKCSECSNKLRDILGSYNKSKPDFGWLTLSRIQDACQRTKTNDGLPPLDKENGCTLSFLISQICNNFEN